MTHGNGLSPNVEMSVITPGDKSVQLPSPAYRHATPSAPWPWIDTEDDIDREQLLSEGPTIPPICDHSAPDDKCWEGYPQSRFPNWTKSQVEKCGIARRFITHDKNTVCAIYQLDINRDGIFKDAGKFHTNAHDLNGTWNHLKSAKPGSDVRVSALFIENMNSPALKMLGAKYDIEPFFFSSSLNQIPSHFQEDLGQKGDHITVTVPFVRSVAVDQPHRTPQPWYTAKSRRGDIRGFTFGSEINDLDEKPVTQEINTQAPLPVRVRRPGKGDLKASKDLISDLLSIHLIRNTEGNTIISYHGDDKCTKAKRLHERVRYAGQSVYWQKMLSQAQDPTLVLLIFIWHAVYAWDEVLGDLYDHICSLEGEVTKAKSIEITQELHIIRAHLLHYSSLLEALKRAVEFIGRTCNPALAEAPDETSNRFLDRECKTLMEEIDRMIAYRTIQEQRVKNVMDLVFTAVNILDSKTSTRDSAYGLKMRQIAYLTMIFLPATFATGIFGMNVDVIVPKTYGTIGKYLATAIPLTAFAVWALVAFESKYLFKTENIPIWQRLCWPFLLPYWLIGWERERREAKRTAALV